MATTDVSLDLKPTTTINTTVPTEPLAAALLKSSENQAVATIALAAALKPQPEPEPLAGLLGSGKSSTLNLALIALIAYLLWK